MSDSINFSWYLTIWLTARFGDERTFWATMTPARCDALYREYARMVSPAKSYTRREEKISSLSQYLMGGGA